MDALVYSLLALFDGGAADSFRASLVAACPVCGTPRSTASPSAATEKGATRMHNLLPPTTTVPVTEQDTVVIVDPVTFDTTAARQPSLDPTRYRRPSLGRVVHALVDPKSSAGSDVAPAVIVQTTADSDVVNLRAFTDSGDLPAWMVGVTVWQTEDEARKNAESGGSHAFWPARPDRPRPAERQMRAYGRESPAAAE